MGSNHSSAATGYWPAWPRYEVRNLPASATILAERGQAQAHEATLGETRDVYTRYAADPFRPFSHFAPVRSFRRRAVDPIGPGVVAQGVLRGLIAERSTCLRIHRRRSEPALAARKIVSHGRATFACG